MIVSLSLSLAKQAIHKANTNPRISEHMRINDLLITSHLKGSTQNLKQWRETTYRGQMFFYWLHVKCRLSVAFRNRKLSFYECQESRPTHGSLKAKWRCQNSTQFFLLYLCLKREPVLYYLLCLYYVGFQQQTLQKAYKRRNNWFFFFFKFFAIRIKSLNCI